MPDTKEPGARENATAKVVEQMCTRVIGASEVTFKGEAMRQYVAILMKYRLMEEDLRSIANIGGCYEGEMAEKLANLANDALAFDPLSNPNL